MALGANLDTLTLGNTTSESAHNVLLTSAPTSTTQLGQSSRRLNTGGEILFDLAVDGTAQNYATVRFWAPRAASTTGFFWATRTAVSSIGPSSTTARRRRSLRTAGTTPRSPCRAR